MKETNNKKPLDKLSKEQKAKLALRLLNQATAKRALAGNPLPSKKG